MKLISVKPVGIRLTKRSQQHYVWRYRIAMDGDIVSRFSLPFTQSAQTAVFSDFPTAIPDDLLTLEELLVAIKEA